MKCSQCSPETSKAEHSAQAAVAMRRKCSSSEAFPESAVLDNAQETELYFPFPQV